MRGLDALLVAANVPAVVRRDVGLPDRLLDQAGAGGRAIAVVGLAVRTQHDVEIVGRGAKAAVQRLEARRCFAAVGLHRVWWRRPDQNDDTLGDYAQPLEARRHISRQIQLHAAPALVHAEHDRIEIDQYRVSPVVPTVCWVTAKEIHRLSGQVIRASATAVHPAVAAR